MKMYKFFKLCPLWRRHVVQTWDFIKIKKFYWICRRCPLVKMDSAGLAYRRTIGEE